MMKEMIRKALMLGGIACMGMLFLMRAIQADAATLSFSPQAKSVHVGDVFTVAVQVSSPDQAINAASGDVAFLSDKLRALSVSTAGSAMSLWVQNPSFSNSVNGGEVNFAGVALNPGFIGASGNVISIKFQAIAAGDAPLSFSAGSVLANDGNGTNVLSSLGTAVVTVNPGEVSPPPLPTPPAPSPAVDNIPPEPFSLQEVTSDLTDPHPVFSWHAIDGGSSISHYSVRIGNGDWFDASLIAVTGTPGRYQLPLQAPGVDIPLLVDAYDQAGNVTHANVNFSILPIPTPVITSYTKIVASLNPTFSIEGTIPYMDGVQVAAVHIYLEKSGETLVFQVPVDSNGKWIFTQHIDLQGGNWTAAVQASDERGALSGISPAVPFAVGGWLNEMIAFLIAWGLIIVTALAVVAGIIAAAYVLMHHLRRGRISLARNLIRERRELRDDLRRIEKELEADTPSSKIDLSNAGVRKKQERVRREIAHLEEDLRRDIEDHS